MKFLNYGMRFYFTRDYITKTRSYPKGTQCNILNGVVVLGKDGEFLFDVNSGMAKRFGQIISQDIFDKNEQKWSDLIDKREEYYDRLCTIYLKIIKLEDENNRTGERLGLELERSLDLKTAQDKKDKARQLVNIKVGDLVLIEEEEGIYKGEKAIVKKVLDDSILRLYVCSNSDSNVFMEYEYVTKVKKKQYSVQEIFDLAEEGDIFVDEYGYNKYIYTNGSINDYETEDDITDYYTLGTIMKMKFFKVIECSKLKINKRDLNNIVKLLKDNGYDYEIEEV